MLKNHLLKISLVLPLVAVSATAHAGSTIKGISYWPSEARQSAPNRTVILQSDLSSAFAYDRATSRLQPTPNTNDYGSSPRYHGGPKSPWRIAFGAQRGSDKHRPPQPFHVCCHQNGWSILGLTSSPPSQREPRAS